MVASGSVKDKINTPNPSEHDTDQVYTVRVLSFNI